MLPTLVLVASSLRRTLVLQIIIQQTINTSLFFL